MPSPSQATAPPTPQSFSPTFTSSFDSPPTYFLIVNNSFPFPRVSFHTLFLHCSTVLTLLSIGNIWHYWVFRSIPCTVLNVMLFFACAHLGTSIVDPFKPIVQLMLAKRFTLFVSTNLVPVIICPWPLLLLFPLHQCIPQSFPSHSLACYYPPIPNYLNLP